MITLIQEPNQFSLAKQTIPFVVSSDLSILEDYLTNGFKYVFEVKTSNDEGEFISYSTVAIPPRPESLVGFFDASSVLQSALGFDTETQMATGVTSCPNSIIEYMLIVKERYVTGTTYVYGDEKTYRGYYAINGASYEGISPYLIDYSTTGGTKPLTHNYIAENDLILRPNEPMSLSFVSVPEVTANLFEFEHGDFGSFDDGSISDYTGITVNSTYASIFQSVSPAISGQSLKVTTKSLLSQTDVYLFKFTDLNLDTNSTYNFNIFFKTPIPIAVNNNYVFTAEVSGDIIATQTIVTKPIHQGNFQWVNLTNTFTTNATGSTGEIEVKINALTGTLDTFSFKTYNFESAKLVRDLTLSNVFDEATIIVDAGLATEAEYDVNGFSTYIPIDMSSKARFDIPCGAYQNVTTSGSTAQDTTTGLFKNSSGNIGTYFNVRLYNDGAAIVGESAKIYQDTTECTRFENVRLKWLNSLGGWDYFTFTKASLASTNIEKDIYKANVGTFTDNIYSEPNNKAGYLPLIVNSQDVITANSDWISKDTAKWLQELFTSPIVYLLNPEVFMQLETNNQYEFELPVTVTSDNYEYYNNAPESKLLNLTVTIEPSHNYNDYTTNA